jgi:primosomal protein N' (replication factor Y)
MASPYLELVFDIPVRDNQIFTYRIDPKGEGAFGKRAMVPFGRRDILGYIIGERNEPPPEIESAAIKEVRRVVDKEP